MLSISNRHFHISLTRGLVFYTGLLGAASALTLSAQTQFSHWTLDPIQQQDQYKGWAENSGLLRIVSQNAGAGGGTVQVEASDRFSPGRKCNYRFIWQFTQGISQLSFEGDKRIGITMRIDGDGGSCLRMDPFMQFATSGVPLIQQSPMGSGQFHYNAQSPNHDPGQWWFRVNQQQGWQEPWVKVMVYVRFPPDREEAFNLHITYPFKGDAGRIGGSRSFNPIGSWTYRDTGTGFTDLHILDPGGAARANHNVRGRWWIQNNVLYLSWPNGWQNRYPIGPGVLTGQTFPPDGGAPIQVTLTPR